MAITPGLSSNTIKRLLFEAQPYVEQHGFRIEAIRAAITSKNLIDENGQTIEQNDISFNFSSQADITKQLLSTFDQQSLQNSSNSLQPSKDKEGNLEKVELLLAGKLLQSASIRDQLVDALAILTGSANKTFVPGISLPLPIIQRAWGVTDEAIYMADWKGKLRTDWYTHRTRLSNAFMLSELHLLSPDFNGDVHQSLHVLRKLARPNQLFRAETVQSTSEWVNWGARGWLGIFRSLGL